MSTWRVLNLNPPSQVRNSEAINLTVKKAPTTKTGMQNLPEEIIIDVLLRLPVKSLLKFKCVSKSWSSLISDPHFIKNHLHMSATNDNYVNHRLLLKNIQNIHQPNFTSFSLDTFFNKPYLDGIIELPHPYPYPRDYTRIVGSCNGLLCITITINNNIFLWNPSTRESRLLPDPAFRYKPDHNHIYGLGYDCSIDDYKLVVIRRAYFQNYGIYQNDGEMKVYTLRTNSWREIQPYPSRLPIPRYNATGIFLGGALIWPAVGIVNDPDESYYSRKNFKIAAFDLANETGQELLTPPVIEDNNDDFRFEIGVLRECLCFIDTYKCTNVDVWVMKEYGLSESWTKLITVPYVGNIFYSTSHNYHPILPIWMSKNGDILLQFKCHSIIYYSKKNTIRYQEVGNYTIPCVYIESLVSPHLRISISTFWKKKKALITV